MKIKKISYFLMFLCLIILFFFSIKRYNALNRPYSEQPLITTYNIKKSEVVQTDAVEFKILDSSIKDNKGILDINLEIVLKSLTPNNYGFKSDNLIFYENMWLDIPYSLTIPASNIVDESGERVNSSNISLNNDLHFTVKFSTPAHFYDKNRNNIYFSFLVPENERFIKYMYIVK